MNFMVLHWIMKSIESDLNPRLVSLFKTEHRISGAGFRGARSAGFKYNYSNIEGLLNESRCCCTD